MSQLKGRYTLVILSLLLAWGAFLRLWNLGGRPFWRDEAWVAESLRDLPFAELWRQTSVPLPPLFAVAAKAVGQVLQPPEFAWRLLPAVCGILALPLMYSLARLLRAPRTLALAVLAVGATSIALITWSRDLKHYSYEALASLLIAWLVVRLRRPAPPARRWALAAAVIALCVVSPWYAYGAVIPLLAMLALLLVGQPLAKPRWPLRAIAVLGLAALALSTYGVYTTVAKAQASDPTLAAYTKMWYIDVPNPRTWLRVGGYLAASTPWLIFPARWFIPLSSESDQLKLGLATVAIWLIVLFGVWNWPRATRRELAWWLFTPLLLMFALTLLHKYPLGVMRMMQFWVPPMLVALTAGVVCIWRGIWGVVVRRPGPALASAVALALLPSLYVVREPFEHVYYVYHDFPTVLRALEQRRAPGDWVLVCWQAVPCVRYYAPHLPPPAVYTPVAGGVILKAGTDSMALARNTAQRAAGRLWILLTANEGGEGDRRKLLEVLTEERYACEVISRGGHEDSPSGSAELLLATRR